MNDQNRLSRYPAALLAAILALTGPSGALAQTVAGSQAGASSASPGVAGIGAHAVLPGAVPIAGPASIAPLQRSLPVLQAVSPTVAPKTAAASVAVSVPAAATTPELPRTRDNDLPSRDRATPSNPGPRMPKLPSELASFQEDALSGKGADASPVQALRGASAAVSPKETRGSVSILQRMLGMIFDGSRTAPAEGSSPVQGRASELRSAALSRAGVSDAGTEEYLRTSPALPLPEVSPIWKKAAGPQEKQVGARYKMGEPELIGEEKADWTFQEKLEFTEEEGTFRTVTSAEKSDDKVVRSQWAMSGKVVQAAQVEHGFVWLTEDGVFRYHDLNAGKTYRIAFPAPVETFAASADGGFVYAVVGGIFQRIYLGSKNTTKVIATTLKVEGPASILPVSVAGKDGKPVSGAMLRVKGARVFWIGAQLFRMPVTEEQVYNEFGGVPGLHAAGDKFYLQKTEEGTRVWRKSWQGSDTEVADVGLLPFAVKSVVETPERGVYLAAVEDGLLEWDSLNARYRVFAVPGLQEAAAGGPITLQVTLDNKETRVQKAFLTAGAKLFQLDIAEAKAYLDSGVSKVRLWSQMNPMSIHDGALHIGDFSFPLAEKKAKPQSFLQRTWGGLLRALGLRKVPAAAEAMGISEKDWKAVNLPTNKKVIYDTLKAFTLRQHVLYIGETGGGKTYIAEMIAKLTGNELWMVSMNEYTRNKDLIARETFGEEGKGRTGLTASTVLRWMQEGGVLLLDEMHKPLEGIAVLNNVLQNGEYRLPDGRVIKYDKKKSWVIGTMNPVKPPYKGEPPSGELSSRFGMTLDVKYLPAEEEAALLRIFFDKVDPALIDKLVAIANDLRK
ncbi:MAG: AAA family ATPase, partial [Elusimicrobiota bacterium]